MSIIVRTLSILFGILGLILTFGFFTQQPWATQLWPWSDSHLSYVWLASICAAVACPVLWIGLSGEVAAVAPGAINLLVTSIGVAIFSYYYFSTQAPLPFTLFFAISIIPLAAITWWSARQPLRDRRRLPVLMYISFLIFVIVLILTGTALVLQFSTIFPWSLSSTTSIIFGWFFLGAATYFLYALLRPRWGNAYGQLIGFLAYDLILIGPFFAHFANVQPAHMLSLIVYLAVIIYSGLLCIYYLLLHRKTRMWASVPLQKF